MYFSSDWSNRWTGDPDRTLQVTAHLVERWFPAGACDHIAGWMVAYHPQRHDLWIVVGPGYTDRRRERESFHGTDKDSALVRSISFLFDAASSETLDCVGPIDLTNRTAEQKKCGRCARMVCCTEQEIYIPCAAAWIHLFHCGDINCHHCRSS